MKEKDKQKDDKEEKDPKEEKEMKCLNNLYYLTDLYFFDFKQAIEDYVILNTIDIKEYLTFESLQAFEIFTNEYPKFQEIVEKFSDEFKNKIEMPKEDNNNNDGDKNKDNDINNSKIFKMPPIKYIKKKKKRKIKMKQKIKKKKVKNRKKKMKEKKKK